MEGIRIPLARWMRTLEMTHALTFVFNAPTTIQAAARKLSEFQRRGKRIIWGSNWQKGPPVTAIFVPENIDWNLHYHAAFAIPVGRADAFELRAAAKWHDLVPAGNLTWARMDAGWLGYITKQLWQSRVAENYLICR